jgi:hypothetical protein
MTVVDTPIIVVHLPDMHRATCIVIRRRRRSSTGVEGLRAR